MVKYPNDLLRLSPHIHLICEHWKIKELAVFGSILRDDFTPTSDIDLLVTFTEDAPWSLWDIVRLKQEFKNILGREIDLIEKSSILNPFIRAEIMKTKQVILTMDN